MPDRPMIGTEFAGYRIEDQVGRGGASVVYVAVNLGLGNRVALKVLAPEFFDDDAVRVRFVRESQMAASINHPNIIPIHNAGSADGYLYIAMRYVEGADLKALIVQEGALRPKRAMAIMRQIARALDTAHQRGLVHRDVKPANILLEEVGTDHEHAYLADFGLTKRRGSHSGLTGSGHFIGTIDYMAPEQIEGGDVDGRADVYALACLGYQCMTGVVPFPKDIEMAVLWAHMNEAPPAPSTTRLDLPAALDGVIARGMAKSPQDRYATCGELVAAMDAALGLHAADAPATGPVRPVEPEPEPVITADEIIAVPEEMVGDANPPEPPAPPVVVGRGGTEHVVSTPEGHERKPPRTPRSFGNRGRRIGAAALAVVVILGVATYLVKQSDSATQGAPPNTSPTNATQSTGLQADVPHKYWVRYACSQDKGAIPIALPGTGKPPSKRGLVLSAVCSPKVASDGASTPLQLDINRYQHVADLDHAYKTLLAGTGLSPAGSSICPSHSRRGMGQWTHMTMGLAGSKFCIPTSPTAEVIVWTLPKCAAPSGHSMLGEVVGPPRVLFAWWHNNRHHLGEGPTGMKPRFRCASV